MVSTHRKKTREQIAFIEETQKATEAAAAEVIGYLKSDSEPSSEHCHLIIDEVLERFGCESPEGHIVAGGVQSASPHEAGSGRLMRGEPIVIDIFPRSIKTGYFADMSRTVCIGPPSLRLQSIYDAVLAAHALAVDMIKPGARGIEIQEAVENHFIECGFTTSGEGKEFPFAEGFVHGVGHGVGQKVHEPPRIGRNSTDVLAVDDVVTVEPGLYYKDVGGVRIEDLVLVTEDGCRNLTNFSKQLML